jgi:hypothetical protein
VWLDGVVEDDMVGWRQLLATPLALRAVWEEWGKLLVCRMVSCFGKFLENGENILENYGF